MIKYISITKAWHDKINGNTYFSTRIEDVENDNTYVLPFQYGYGSQHEYATKEILNLKGFNSDLPIRFVYIPNCKKSDVDEHGSSDKQYAVYDKDGFFSHYYLD
tara:strand:- start:360 stop:671 length:312 start_codon:yes stop_codon:yes gene_type:complete